MKKSDKNNNKNWKKDFPIRKEEASMISRRDFARFLTVISGGLVFGNGLVAANAFIKSDKEEVKEKEFVCTKSDIPVGGTKSFTLKGDTVPYILIHTEENEFYSYEQKCTHLSCAVYYKPKSGKIECPCHNGYFDVKTGNVLEGPPPRPLKKLTVTVEGENIYVS